WKHRQHIKEPWKDDSFPGAEFANSELITNFATADRHAEARSRVMREGCETFFEAFIRADS
ncbi:MAG: hypothetical protein K2M05_02540, partial [Paramuribaculum sp.]|nr:hypothetical protein [Paramuribaculum sp.]